MALSNVTQLKEILDIIYTESQSPDPYSGDGKNGLMFYYDEMTQTAKIYSYDDEDNEYIIAIFNPENLVYADDEDQIVHYIGKCIKDCTTTGTGSGKSLVKDAGLGALIDIKKYIRNICAFLGASMSNDFDSKNPLIYNDLVNIILKYSGDLDNNSPYFWAKIPENSDYNYRSYIPVLCLVDIAIYLNNLGVFNDVIPYQPAVSCCLSQYGNISLTSNSRSGNKLLTVAQTTTYQLYKFLPQAKDVYTFNDKSTFRKKYKDWAAKYNVPEFDEDAINLFFSIFEPNFNNVILMQCTRSSFTVDGQTVYKPRVICYDIPKEMYFQVGTSMYMETTNSYGWNFGINHCGYQNYAGSYICFNYGEVRSYKEYEFHYRYNVDHFELEYNTTTTGLNSGESVTVYGNFTNIKCDKIIKGYIGNTVHYMNHARNVSTTPLLYFNYLSNNVLYSFDILKHINNFVTINNVFPHFYNILKDNINIENKLCIVCFSSLTELDVFVFSNIDKISSSSMGTFLSRFKTSNLVAIDIKAVYGAVNVTYNSLTLNFNTDVNMDKYSVYIDTSDYTQHCELIESTTVNSFTPSEGGWSNLGEIIDVLENELDGFELIQNSVYPSNVVDQASFLTLYNNAFYKDIKSPYFVDDELQLDTHTTKYVNCSVSKTPPDNQADAQDFDLDDLSDDEVADIIKDIDKASGDDDSPEDDVPPNEEGFEEEGNSPAPEPIDNLAEPLDFGMFKMYVLTRAQAVDVGHNLAAADFWSFADKFFNNPIDSIISLQSTNVITANDSTSVVEAVQINGKTLNNPAVTARRLTKSKSEIDLGYIEIPAKYNNYLDITNTKMKIYLPFVGFVDLNIAEFVGGGMNLWARIDHYTGDIVYFIYSSRNSLHRCVATAQGNSQKQIPLTSNNFMRFFQGLLGGS